MNVTEEDLKTLEMMGGAVNSGRPDTAQPGRTLVSLRDAHIGWYNDFIRRAHAAQAPVEPPVDPAAGVRVQDAYSPLDMHAVTIMMNPGGDVVAIPFTGPAQVSGALPEGSGGQLCVSRTPGEFSTDDAMNSVGRGLLVYARERGQLYANVKLLSTMTASAPLTFNAGAL